MQHSFFDQEVFDLKNAEINYTTSFFEASQADKYYEELLNNTPWQQDDIVLFGKRHAQPRLTALYGFKQYGYSNIKMTPNPFTPTLLAIKNEIEQYTKYRFNACLLNYYRDGNDSNGWHSDDEKELGTNPVIASLSFGAERMFHLRHKHDKKQRYKIPLTHNSLLLMAGETQTYWQHQIPKTTKVKTGRINLTFRLII